VIEENKSRIATMQQKIEEYEKQFQLSERRFEECKTTIGKLEQEKELIDSKCTIMVIISIAIGSLAMIYLHAITINCMMTHYMNDNIISGNINITYLSSIDS